ncbi:hypothetical protein BKA62DRAFT_723557 [Auriculariales sp. MPI-PUGE-AT-0066]|nr:hypothetical protein BKA62DRAFT_723557 [Auriculariales sp. MPI-PUGE-AT-0066]
MNSNPFVRLPNEICYTIFNAFALNELVLLMPVCRRWRDLALGHPTYSSRLDLQEDATPPELYFFFARANRAALSRRRLTVDAHVSWDTTPSIAKRTVDAVALNRGHIVQLRLCFHPEMFSHVLHALRTMAHVERLDLTAQQHEEDSHDQVTAKAVVWASGGAYISMPKLQHIRLAGLRLDGLPPSMFESVVSLVLALPWDGQSVMDALTALRDLVVSGNIVLLMDERLVVNTRCIDVQWPVLRQHLTKVRLVEFNMINQAGTDAVADQIEGEISARITIRPSDLCIVFSLTGECGKTVAFAYGGDGYETLPEEPNKRDIQRVSGQVFAARIRRAEIDADMWDSQRARDYAYPILELITLVWMEQEHTGCSVGSPDKADTMIQLDMPVGGTALFCLCPNLRTLRLENRISNLSIACIDVREVEDFARRSFIQINIADIVLELSGIVELQPAHAQSTMCSGSSPSPSFKAVHILSAQ